MSEELLTRFENVLALIEKLEDERELTTVLIERLEEKGTTTATIHWRRKDDPDGKPDMLELVHRQGSDYERQHGRRREYIGIDETEIKEALARRARYQKCLSLRDKVYQLERQVNNIKWAIKNVFRVAGEQTGDLWGHQGQSRPNLVSPSDGDNGDNGEWGQRGAVADREMSPQASVPASPKSVSPQDMDELKAHFAAHSDPFLQSLANDVGKSIRR